MTLKRMRNVYSLLALAIFLPCTFARFLFAGETEEIAAKFWFSKPDFASPIMKTSLGPSPMVSIVDLAHIYVSCLPGKANTFRVNVEIKSRSARVLGQNNLFYFGVRTREASDKGVPVDISDESRTGIEEAFRFNDVVEMAGTVVQAFDEYSIKEPELYLESVADAGFLQSLLEADRLMLITKWNSTGEWSAVVEGRIDFQRDQASQFLAACLATSN